MGQSSRSTALRAGARALQTGHDALGSNAARGGAMFDRLRTRRRSVQGGVRVDRRRVMRAGCRCGGSSGRRRRGRVAHRRGGGQEDSHWPRHRAEQHAEHDRQRSGRSNRLERWIRNDPGRGRTRWSCQSRSNNRNADDLSDRRSELPDESGVAGVRLTAGSESFRTRRYAPYSDGRQFATHPVTHARIRDCGQIPTTVTGVDESVVCVRQRGAACECGSL